MHEPTTDRLLDDVRALQARIKAALPLLDLSRQALATEADWQYSHLKTVLGAGCVRRLADPLAALQHLWGVLERVAHEQGVVVTVDVQPVAA